MDCTTVEVDATPARPPEHEAGFDIVVADASWPWTENLFAPMADLGVRILLIKACDWRNAWQQRKPLADWLCPRRRISDRHWQQTIVLPPGWMKSYPRIGMTPIYWTIEHWRRSLSDHRPLVLAISYPYYLALRDQVRPDVLLYYNTDDYGLYWASRRDSVKSLERRAVGEADLSVFIARLRADELRAAVPEAADRIIHLPLGAPANAIAPAPQARPAEPPDEIDRLPRPLLGFVGSLEDRIDWGLLEKLAGAFPRGSIILIGRDPKPQPREAWYRAFQRTVAMPNVHRLGWRTQDEIARFNAAFDVCLIPYKADHPFNQAACPTKIMDYMATSRPVVTTPVPECQLYAHLFEVADTPAAFVAAVRKVVDQGSDDGRAPLRWRTARSSTWEQTSATMLCHLRSLIPA
jgi:glycosyltransferase involved in cell wall biosynthesis